MVDCKFPISLARPTCKLKILVGIRARSRPRSTPKLFHASAMKHCLILIFLKMAGEIYMKIVRKIQWKT
jgi:hypothetical protein